MQLAGKVALITGAGSGMGRATAATFAREGAKVVVADLNGAAAEATVGQIRAAGGEAVAVTCDVTQSEQVAAAVAAAVTRYGGLDVLHANAGIPMTFTPAEQVSEALFDRLFAVNVKGVWLSCQKALPHLKARQGCILITASTAGLRPRPGLTPYNASKGALITLTKSLAIELAPDKVRVNCICPVATETPMLQDFIGRDRDQAAGREAFAATVPLGRLATPEDIAAAALYLCSDAASLVTGVALEIDGGRCI